jgi:pheromone a factor receptor
VVRRAFHCPPGVADDASLSLVHLNSHGFSVSHLLLALSTMVEPLYPLFPIASFLGFVLVLIPLPWHLQAWNSGTCFFVLWTSLACLNQFINSVMWANDALNKAPVWCDICKRCPPPPPLPPNLLTRWSYLATRIMLGAAVGIPASSLCIMRRLHGIAKIQAVSPTHAEVCNTFFVL